MGIATPGGRRNHSELDWRIKALLFTISGALGGAVVGLVLGWLGDLVGTPLRLAIASVLALLLLSISVADLTWKRIRPLERDRETSQAWLHLGAVRWAVLNGFALGMGFTSRIGFIAWYFIPFACFAAGSPTLGAIIFGCYGLARGAAVWLWFAVMNIKKIGQDEVAEPLFARKYIARKVSSYVLATSAMASIVIVGL